MYSSDYTINFHCLLYILLLLHFNLVDFGKTLYNYECRQNTGEVADNAVVIENDGKREWREHDNTGSKNN